MAAAHGGQILASESSVDAAGTIPGLVSKPAGRYRLRDFDEPVRLYNVAPEGAELQFPAVHAVPADGHNLVAPPTSLVGRREGIELVADRVASHRLVTLTGPGGVGKTRIAVATGLAAASEWDDGVWYVDLSPVVDGALVRDAVSSAVGVRPVSGDDRRDTLDHLGSRRSLLIFDNCEHLLSDVAAVVADLLAQCPMVSLLATSREPLGIEGEAVVRVDPLRVPEANTRDLATALEAPAVRLFVERARAVRPDFSVDAGTIDAVVAICRQLDGLPLALELAAAHTSVLSPADLLEGLRRDLGLLRTRGQSRPDRQRTMDAVFNWSFGLLAPDEQTTLPRLGLFGAGFSLESAAAALGDDVKDVPSAIWGLADASLVVVDLVANETRYRMLETVRSCARRRLDDAGETDMVAERLAAWALERFGPWHPMDRTRSGDLAVELDTLRGLVPLVARAAPEQAQQIACSLGRFFYTINSSRDHTAELAEYASDLSFPSDAHVAMLSTLAILSVEHGDGSGARRAIDAAVREREILGGPPAWDDVGIERAMGELALRERDYSEAAEIARTALARELSLPGRNRMYNLLGIALYFGGDATGSAEALEQELDTARLIGDEHRIAIAEANVAELALSRGDAATAARHQAASLEIGLALGRPTSVAQAMIVAARLVAQTDPERAAELHAKAEQVLADAGSLLYDEDLRASNEMLDAVQQRLGDRAFSEACERGRALSVPDAAVMANETFAQLLP